MIPGITEVNFPAYATLHEATISLSEMGENIITAQIRIDGDIVPDFSNDWKVMYKGEVFVLNTHTPQATKDNTSRCSLIDATFTSFPVAELKRYFFVELSEVETGTMIVDKYVASLRVNAYNFIAAFNRVLQYYFGNLFTIEVAAGATLDPEVKDVELDYTYLWEAVGKLYDVYGLVWKLGERNGRYYITVGDSIDEVSEHIFEYGYEGGLTRIERQLEDAEIYNQLLGRGGTKNLPYRYFKKTDPYNEIWAADPDACAELENVYFERLMDVNFRYYVKGWLRNPNRTPSADYPVPSTPEPAEIQQHWAYQKGLTDANFQPIEYVEDAASVAEYGVRQGKLEDDDEIYPTIQGITVSPYGRIDEIVAVGPITDGDDSGVVDETAMADISQSVTTDLGLPMAIFDFYGPEFSIPANRRGEIRYNLYMSQDTTGAVEPNFAYASTINTDFTEVVAERLSDGQRFPVSSIPGGDNYKLRIHFAINKFPTAQQTTRIIGLQNVKLITSLLSVADDNPYCFRVWVKNIWQTAKGANESDLEYMKRVWEPILGDRLGNEAKIVFSDGWMSASSDYEFTIVDWPKFDQSKSRNGVQSEWMLTLAKSDAEVDTTGKFIPNATSAKPVAGDHFFFTGIDMPHIYVVWAEKKLNEKKQDALDAEAYANPTWAVQLDPVRINTLVGNEDVTLFSQLAVGKVMKIYDPRFSGGQVLGLAIRSMTITWHEGTVMKPSVDVVLSENVLSRTSYGGIISPSVIDAKINESKSHIVEEVKLNQQTRYLSKTQDDIAVGRLQMAAGATFGAISRYEDGAQQTTIERIRTTKSRTARTEEVPAASIDEGGHAEFDSMRLRKWLEVPEMRYNRTEVQVGNQWRAPGGGIIESVVPDTDAQGNVLNTGTINLKLEDGEIGKVAVDDICMGIFHDSINENSNAVADMDDSKGNFKFSGFYTTYFRITKVLGDNNQCVKYILRGVSESWTQTFHPCAQMHFVCYGNFDNEHHADRQNSRYSTRTYERYLKNVNTWEFQASNVAAQFGDLSNLTELGLPGMTGYSTYIENIYMTGHIQQVGLPLRIEADWSGQNILAAGDIIDMAFNVMQGFDNLNQQVASWSIERDSGDAVADAAWNQAYDGWDGNVATLQSSDLGTTGISTLFMVTAVMDDEDDTEVQYGFTLMSTQDASNVVLLDLDNENDSMLYNAEGTLLSGSVTSEAHLYVGNTEITSGVTYTIAASTGITASISGNVITVSAMGSVSSGYVIVSASFGGNTYTKQLNITKIVGNSKYDLVISPSAIAYNTTTNTPSSVSVNIKVHRTSASSDGTTTRTVLTALPTGWKVYANTSALSYGSSGANFSATSLSTSSFTITLRNSNGDIVDSETIPVNKSANGSDGKGISSTEIRYARSNNGTSAPSSDWQNSLPTLTDDYPFLWTRTTITYTSGDPSTSYSVSRKGEPGGAGGPGNDAIYLDLDNENASFLYVNGTNVSGSIISTAKLYKGGVAVSSGVTYAIAERSGCTSSQATISSGVVTVTGINTAGYVKVSATYQSVTYYAYLNLTMVVGDVMYDLVVTPNSIAYNATTNTKSASSISVKIYKTAQTSANSSSRTLMSSVPSGYKLYNGTTDVSSSYSSGYTIQIPSTPPTYYEITLKLGDVIADQETIPINKVENGGQGPQGDMGPAVVFRGDYSKLSGATFYSDDKRVDVVKYSSNYYKLKASASPYTWQSSWNSSEWESFGASFDSVATGLLYAENANTDNLSVYRVRLLNKNNLSASGVETVGGLEAATPPSSGTPTESQNICLWLGASSKSTSAPFYVTKDGKLKAANAEITGKITSTEGSIGGLIIDSDGLVYKYGSGSSAVERLRLWSSGNIGLVTNDVQNQMTYNGTGATLSLKQNNSSGRVLATSGGRIEIDSILTFYGSQVIHRLYSAYTLPSNAVAGHTELLFSATSSNITVSAPSGTRIYRGNSSSTSIVLKQSARYFAILYYDGNDWFAFQPDCIYGD